MITCQPFTIMRLTHEAIRRGLEQVDKLSETLTAETLDEWTTAFQEVTRCVRLHARQEDYAFYPPLEEKRPGLTTPFAEEHSREMNELAGMRTFFISAQVDTTQIPAVLEMVRNWTAEHKEHLKHEEDLLMPILSELFLFVESVKVVRGILEYDLKEFETFQLPWVFQRLNSRQRGTYLSMLQGCSPVGKFPDFVEMVRPFLTSQEVATFEEEGVLRMT